MKKFTTTLALFLLFSFTVQASFTGTFHVSKSEVFGGYIVKKVWLDNYAMPKVRLTGLSYLNNVSLPTDALPSNPEKFEVVLGKERKRPFAFVRIPVFAAGNDTKQVNQLSDFTLVVEEQPKADANNINTAAKTTAASSVLATGGWYKISVSATGLYKIDFDLLNKLGINPSTINPANIRVFGNGGNMLPEDNSKPRKNDLVENAVWVNDGGDGVFNQGDYVAFYAVGPVSWSKDSANQKFTHTNNLYSDKAYYFLNFDQAALRIADQQNAPAGNETVTDFNDYMVHEQDLVNLGGFGKEWWGEEFSNNPGKTATQSFSFNAGTLTDVAKFHVVLGSRTPAAGNVFNISVNGQPSNASGYYFGAAAQNDDDDPVAEGNANFNMAVNGAINVQISYQPSISTGSGFLNFIEINTRKSLDFAGQQELSFRDWRSVGIGKVATYNVQGAGTGTQVWDVTDPQMPVRMAGSLNGSTYTFTQDAQSLHEFVALNGSQIPVPEYVEKVANQDLHGSGPVDLIIVTHPDFAVAANQLADFHRALSSMRVIVATTGQVYNEFSSGSQDISAIRDFARMFYDRAGNDSTQMPRYLLLYGDASYDYKGRIANNSNYVPTFESAESHVPINGFCNDDFFGFLDDNENIENTLIPNTLDIGVGRLPVTNAGDAMAMVNKISHYKSAASLGPWRLATTFVTDNSDDAGDHMQDGEDMSSTVHASSNIYNDTKVYVDAIPWVSTPGGSRSPDANKDINDQIYKGTFLVNYNGHGNTQVWASERILTVDDFGNWKNIDKLPFMVTATCDFGRFDHPEYVSAGEGLVLKNDGGVIAGLTTTQLVYASSNHIINQQFLRTQFAPTPTGWNTFGDAFRIGKNLTYENTPSPDVLVNFRKFALLGDPALEPDFPKYKVFTDSIKDGTSMQRVDSIGALGSYVMYGSVRDLDSNILSNFNGNLYVTIYDKVKSVPTITTPIRTFKIQNSIIYKGKISVQNGNFSYTFITPKDINYDFGRSKVSYYADNGVTDAAGSDTSIIVGGFSDHPITENNPPRVRAYIGDSLFKDGGITGSNTLLYAILEDETGINVSGNSVGHDLTAVLDDDVQHPYTLNDYYETAPNTYKRGYVNFPISGLADGKHTFRVRAWDVNDNSGEGTVNFEVVDGNVVKVQDLINYPNPFTDVTHFFFQHNHPDELLDVQINIYSTAGYLVRTIKQTFTPSGSRSNEITWDGTADGGAKLPSGVYIYRMSLATQKGIHTTAYQKLVLIR